MDGSLPLSFKGREHRTLRAPIGCVGVGVHSGRRTRMELQPAPAGTGILFHRTDCGVDIPARWDLVADTRLCTMLAAATNPDVRVGTVEHVMAALAGAEVTDVVIAVDGPELPILDGSAAPFQFLIGCAGTVALQGALPWIEVLNPVRVQDADGAAFAELLPPLPGAAPGLEMALTIDFPGTVIGRQEIAQRLTPRNFRHLADARTFAMAADVSRLRAAGLCLGGSLDNAVVVDGPLILNPGGLRSPDEFVRHKLLDAVGDLALAGPLLSGRFQGHCSGHALNNRLLRALFSEAGNWHLHRPAERSAEALPRAVHPQLATAA